MKNKLSIKLSVLLLTLMPQIAFASSTTNDDFTALVACFIFMSIFYVLGVLVPANKTFESKPYKMLIIILLFFARLVVILPCYFLFGAEFLVLDLITIMIFVIMMGVFSSIYNSFSGKKKEETVQQLLSDAAVGNTSVINAGSAVNPTGIDPNKCIECGGPITLNDCFCPNCKTINIEFLKKGIFYTCNKCFNPVRYDQTFCTACGNNVAGFGKTSHYYSIETKPLLFKPYKCSKCNNMIDDMVHECCECHTINNKYKGPVPRTICSKCGTKITDSQEFCTGCGSPTSEVKMVYGDYLIQKKYVLTSEVDNSYFLSETYFLDNYVSKELKKYSISEKGVLPRSVVQRKKILKVLLAVLMIIFTSLIFFHRNIWIYIGLIIAMIGLFVYTRKYTTKSYIIKEIKARPSEKMANIILGIKNDLIKDNSNIVLIVGLILAIIIPSIVFFNPRAIYEPNGDGLALRFYTYGIVGNSKAVIPAEVDGKKVTSIRGDVFANLYLLQEVELPETIEEIRGGAFANDIFLQKINLPSKITEIKGNTFENCASLKSITIPDSVTRIGGHAFYGNSNLSEVVFTENSKLQEIGSSAFRKCDSLQSITIPYGVSINERAFKESPTTIYHFESADNSNNDTSSWDNNYIIPHDIQ